MTTVWRLEASEGYDGKALVYGSTKTFKNGSTQQHNGLYTLAKKFNSSGIFLEPLSKQGPTGY